MQRDLARGGRRLIITDIARRAHTIVIAAGDRPEPACYVLALRAQFQQREPQEFYDTVLAAPRPWFDSAGF